MFSKRRIASGHCLFAAELSTSSPPKPNLPGEINLPLGKRHRCKIDLLKPRNSGYAAAVS